LVLGVWGWTSGFGLFGVRFSGSGFQDLVLLVSGFLGIQGWFDRGQSVGVFVSGFVGRIKVGFRVLRRDVEIFVLVVAAQQTGIDSFLFAVGIRDGFPDSVRLFGFVGVCQVNGHKLKDDDLFG
jgi:hypothetical protein